ncbi:MAG: hypothetical protein KGY38_02275 [Desulfobacterales bacterium]|nr:hypothetical protein [Desulfobacterales bacterium]
MMKDSISHCKRYLMDALGIPADLAKLKKTGSLPFFLHDLYDFYTLSLLGKEFVVLAEKNGTELTPGKIRNHVHLVGEKLRVQAIFLGKSLSPFNRKRLIGYKVPFIVPDNQMYLPDLGLDLREHFIKAGSKAGAFSPATQAVVVYVLAQKQIDSVTPKELAEKLGYSMMSMSRAVDEIEAAGLAQVTSEGKRRVVRFEKGRRQFWEKAVAYLKTPVNKRLWATALKAHRLLLAGESALARYSMIASPGQPVYAISHSGWKAMERKGGFQEVPYPEEAEIQLELWRYDPRLFAEGDTVDPFSLYLSLKEVQDERIESALEEMMEKIKW